jgi:ABC-type transporter Mla MlaB component
MNSKDLQILRMPDGYMIKVAGRANFEYGMPLRAFVRSLEDDYGLVRIDLKECVAMDSTFMGILAMLGLKSKKNNSPIEIVNSSEYTQSLLKSLGLTNLFHFVEGEYPPGTGETFAADGPQDMLETAETVVEAHKTLVDADAANQEKFKEVINYAEKDLKKLKEQDQ